MLRKFVFVFAILALAAAFAGTVPARVPSYSITVVQPAVVHGTTLTPGDYRLTLDNGKATFLQGKQSIVTVDVKVENQSSKIDTTALRFEEHSGQQNLREIRLGGTKLKLIFE